MEAEVLLSPPVMADVNGNNKLASAELEVLKLQELVRKLEKQNEQLRTRANAVNNCPIASHHHHHPPLTPPPPQQQQLPGSLVACLPAARDHFSVKCEPCAREPFAYFQPSSSSSSPDAAEEEVEDEEKDANTTVLDEVDILDLSTVLPATQPDSWLYVSPRAKLQGSDSGLSPLQWCRQVLDHPGPEVELARMTLCHRLDQAKRWRGTSSVRPYSCIDGLSTLSCPVQPYSKPAVLTESTALSSAPIAASPSSSPGPPLVQSTLPLRTSCSLNDRAPTFLSNSALHNVGRQRAAISPQSSVDSEAGISELEDDSISMGYKLQDMTDVEVMARLQEESLRQDYASTSATASRRCSSFSLNSLRRSEVDLEEDDEEDEGYDQLPPPQPRLFRTGSMQRSGGGLPHSHTFSSFRDCRRSSNASTFSLAALVPYNAGTSGLSTDTHYRNSTDMKLRRSMPNLIRAPSMPSVPCLAPSSMVPPSHGPSSLPTMSSLRSSQSFDSSSGLARLQSSIPPPGQLSQRVQSVGNFPAAPRQLFKATAYVSPTVLQGPVSLSTSTSLHSIPSSTALPQTLKPAGSSVPLPVKTATATPGQAAFPRSSLPRPASFVGISGVSRSSKISQPTRSMLTPPKSLASLTTLRDASWKDGCY